MQQQPHSAFSPPFCSDDLSPDSTIGEEGKGGEGELQSEVESQPQPEQQQQEAQPQTQPPQTQPPQPEPQPQPQPRPESKPQPQPEPEPEPQPAPEPEPQPQVEAPSEDAPQDTPEAPSPCREDQTVAEQEKETLEEVVEAKRKQEGDEPAQSEPAQAEPERREGEAAAAQEEEEEEEGGGAKGGGAGRRASLHHTASPLRVQRNGAGSHSATSDYELSLDLKNKQVGLCWDGEGGRYSNLCVLYVLWSDMFVTFLSRGRLEAGLMRSFLFVGTSRPSKLYQLMSFLFLIIMTHHCHRHVITSSSHGFVFHQNWCFLI